MSNDEHDLEQVRAECLELVAGLQTLMLSTVSASGEPDASYAPYVRGENGCYYINVSTMSAHTGNLQATERAAIMLVEDEAQSSSIFIRRRLMFRCDAVQIDRKSDEWETMMTAFEARFGAMIATLRELADFILFRLEPGAGQYVRGFGQAYRLQGPELRDITHRGPPAKT